MKTLLSRKFFKILQQKIFKESFNDFMVNYSLMRFIILLDFQSHFDL